MGEARARRDDATGGDPTGERSGISLPARFESPLCRSSARDATSTSRP